MQTMNEPWTPGPWRLTHLDSALEGADGTAVIWGSDDDIVGPAANLRLIKEAPEMAELLAETLADFDQESTGVQVSGGNAPQIRALLSRIRGA